MTIKLAFDGPKGIGKSTLLRHLQQLGVVTDVHWFNGNWDGLMTETIIKKHHLSSNVYGHDRGYVSNFIYTFLMGNTHKPFHLNVDGSQLIIHATTAITLTQIENYLFSLEDKLVILYADDVTLLEDRIAYRQSFENKGATDDELMILKQSNDLFKVIGLFLQSLYPDKVICIEVSRLDTIDDILAKL